jgi:hypothetical protein
MEVSKMDFSYDDAVEFFKSYFETFNKYGQDPATIRKMDDFFAPDLEFKPYVADVAPAHGRQAFYDVLVSHPSGYEKLTPLDIVYDEKKQVGVVLILAEISDTKSGELLVKKHYFVRYPLVPDENGKMKIKELKLFWEVLPAGSMELNDVFARDWNR